MTPMTKNRSDDNADVCADKINKYIFVTDKNKTEYGTTYLRRAKGLVKKGRAEWISGNCICLNELAVQLSPNKNADTNALPPKINLTGTNHDSLKKTEESIVENTNNINRITFICKDFNFNTRINSNVGERTYLTMPDNSIELGFCLSDSSRSWTEITAKNKLEPNTEYLYCFWNQQRLNRWDGTRKFEIIIDDDFENRMIFHMEDHYIMPVLKTDCHIKDHYWNLLEIPFKTGKKGMVTFNFIVQDGPTFIAPAKNKEEYANHENIMKNLYSYGYNNEWQQNNFGNNNQWQKTPHGYVRNNQGPPPPPVPSPPPIPPENIINDVLKNTLRSKLEEEALEKLRSEMEKARYKDFQSELKEAIREDLRAELEDEIRDELRDELEDEVREELEGELSEE